MRTSGVTARMVERALTGQSLIVHGDGAQTRCFTYVDDAVRGTFLIGTIEAAIGQVFNLADEIERAKSFPDLLVAGIDRGDFGAGGCVRARSDEESADAARRGGHGAILLLAASGWLGAC